MRRGWIFLATFTQAPGLSREFSSVLERGILTGIYPHMGHSFILVRMAKHDESRKRRFPWLLANGQFLSKAATAFVSRERHAVFCAVDIPYD